MTRYNVAKDGVEQGAGEITCGEMTLASDGRSWSDVPLDHGRPVRSLLMACRKQS